MLYYCAFTWHPGTTREKVGQRLLQQDEAGALKKDQIRGWYSLAGGGAGFLIIESETPQQLNQILTPYMDLMSWDVRAIFELDYTTTINNIRQELAQPVR